MRAAVSLSLEDAGEGSDDDEPLPEARLELALTSLPDALASPNPTHRIQAIQAEVLLARYYFREGRILEGHYHVAAAASAALGCRLHQIEYGFGVGATRRGVLGESAATGLDSLSLLGSGSLLELPPPRDTQELGERIKLFWTVRALDLCWSIALDRPASIPCETVISTPLPRNWEDYDRVRIRNSLPQKTN